MNNPDGKFVRPEEDETLFLRPLTQLSFSSARGKSQCSCASGRQKWRRDTNALSIKAAIIDGLVESSTEPVRLCATSGEQSMSFVLPEGLVATFTHAIGTRKQPTTHHYRIEGRAEIVPDGSASDPKPTARCRWSFHITLDGSFMSGARRSLEKFSGTAISSVKAGP